MVSNETTTIVKRTFLASYTKPNINSHRFHAKVILLLLTTSSGT